MNSRIFIIDFDKLVKWLIPTRLRGLKMLAWIAALIAPVKSLYSSFQVNRNANIYELKHTPQVCHIQAVLNDKYDNGLRRIRVLPGIHPQPFWHGNDANNDTDYLGNDGDGDLSYFPHDADLLDGTDAIIEVPALIMFDIIEMKSLIDNYRLCGKHNYKIVIV